MSDGDDQGVGQGGQGGQGDQGGDQSNQGGQGGQGGNQGGQGGYTESDVDRRVTAAVKKRDSEWQGKLEEETSKLRSGLDEATSKLKEESSAREARERELRLYKEAVKAGAVDPEGTAVLVTSLGYVKDDGSVDWDQVKKDRTYLFQQEKSPGKPRAGEGSGSRPNKSSKGSAGMSRMIREAAGREE